MSGYFRRLVARAGGEGPPPSPLMPTLPREPRAADEADPFETIAGPAPAADRPDDRTPRASPPPPRGEATIPSAESAEGIAPRVVVPTTRTSVSPEHPFAVEPAERPRDQDSSRQQQSILTPPAPATPAPARTDRREERVAAPVRQEQDAEPRPLSPQKPTEPIATRIGTVERIVERSRERSLEPRDVFLETPPPMPPRSGEERATPPPVVTLSPPPPAEERAEAPRSDEPRLVIGRLQVEVAPPPARAPETVRVITREAPARPRSDGRASNLRFGLGQM